MPVPDFQSMMLPFLQFSIDGKEHNLSSIAEYIAQRFNLSPEERNDSLPSGNQTRLYNRVGWARTHLKNAGLIEYVRPGVFRITQRGHQVMATNPAAINVKFLDQFPEHLSFRKIRRKETSAQPAASIGTPEEQLEAVALDLKEKLAAELLELAGKMDPVRFERLVLDLLLAMGYGGSREEAASMTKLSHDEGIDGVINEDRLGLDVIYVQAKRWQQTVGRKEIQSFVGALAGQQAHKGIFITTSDFADTARSYVKNVREKVILINGQRLAELLIQHNVGVSLAQSYDVKRVNRDYFDEA